MKVLILANSSKGLFNFRKELLKELKNPGVYVDSVEHEPYDVLICVPEKINNENFTNIGCKVININLDRRGKNPLKDLKLIKNYKKIISDYKPDIVLTYTIKPNIYGGIAAHRYKIPYLVNITGLGTSIHSNNFSSKFIKKLYKIGVKSASEIFVQNKYNFEFFKKNIDDNANYSLIPGSGINLSKFVYKKYPDKQTPIKFITIGRIMRDKGIDELMYAIQSIRRKYGDKVEFDIAGSFDDDSYKVIIEELDHEGIINYRGHIDNIPHIIGDYHCIIHPSYHEGLSNVLLEAGATGRPVIASDVPGCKETFVDGETGLAVKPRDSNDLINKIEEFISIPYEKKIEMGKANRSHVEKNFDRKIVVEKYLECIKKFAK